MLPVISRRSSGLNRSCNFELSSRVLHHPSAHHKNQEKERLVSLLSLSASSDDDDDNDNDNDNDDDNDDEDQLPPTTSVEDTTTKETSANEQRATIKLSLAQSIQTIGYRAAMLAVTTIYGLQESAIPFLTQEAGLQLDTTVDTLQLLSQDYLLRGLILTTCVLAPSSSRSSASDNGGSWLQAEGIIQLGLLASGVATLLPIGIPPAVLGLISLCLREIFYFGIAYKVEAALSILTLVVDLGSSLSSSCVFGGDEASTSASIPAVLHLLTFLSLGVLVFGKFLEPLREDWSMNDSEFLSENRLD
jgi:hypothetical protein